MTQQPNTPDGFESAFEAFLDSLPDEAELNAAWDMVRAAFVYGWQSAGGVNPTKR